MYDVDLSESLFPAQTDGIVRETTVGGVLREVAAQHSSAPAVVAVDMDGQTGRSWTYGELLADSEKLALALSTRFRPGERITIWSVASVVPLAAISRPLSDRRKRHRLSRRTIMTVLLRTFATLSASPCRRSTFRSEALKKTRSCRSTRSVRFASGVIAP